MESSTQSWTELSTMLLQRQSHTSTLKYLQSLRVLIQESLILATHTLTLLSGMLRQKTLLRDSSRTSLNTKEMKLVKHLLLLVLSYKNLAIAWNDSDLLFYGWIEYNTRKSYGNENEITSQNFIFHSFFSFANQKVLTFPCKMIS